MYDSMYGTWNDLTETPADVFRRNFWFCAIDDPSAYRQLDVMGRDNVMVESDYPHADSTWPNTQQMLREHLAGLSDDDVQRVTWRNASALFRHDVPEAVRQDPNAY
jgi:predicted TIM-barrel fold metal-dependent hydrolase